MWCPARDDKAILQVEQAGGEVVVLTDGVDSPVSLLKGNLLGLFDQQRADMPAAHLAVDLQVVQVEVAEGRVLQDGKADTVAAVVCTDKDGVLGEGVEVILLVGEAHLRDGFRGKAFGPIAPAASW